MAYRQCRLQCGDRQQVAWIPEEMATAGEKLRIKRDGGWDVGWCVISIGAQTPDERVNAPGWANLWKKHRKRTDLKKGTLRS